MYGRINHKLEKTRDIAKGLLQVAQTLRNTQVTIKHPDVTVTITAEPTVISIQINQNADIKTLPDKVKICLNEALRESTKKIIKQTTKELRVDPT